MILPLSVSILWPNLGRALKVHLRLFALNYLNCFKTLSQDLFTYDQLASEDHLSRSYKLIICLKIVQKFSPYFGMIPTYSPVVIGEDS